MERIMNQKQKDNLNEIRALALLMMSITEELELDGKTLADLGCLIIDKIDNTLINMGKK